MMMMMTMVDLMRRNMRLEILCLSRFKLTTLLCVCMHEDRCYAHKSRNMRLEMLCLSRFQVGDSSEFDRHCCLCVCMRQRQRQFLRLFQCSRATMSLDL